VYSAGIGELYPRRGVVPAKKYHIELTAEEQQELKALVSKGRAAAYKQTHARILLLSDEVRKDGGLTDEEAARSLESAKREASALAAQRDALLPKLVSGEAWVVEGEANC
jgi:hypothetical protein